MKWKSISFHGLRASFTVEASLVMPVILFSIVFLIMAGFELHDIVLGNLVANEAAELYGHLPGEKDEVLLEDYGNQRLGAVLSQIRYSLELEQYKDGSRVRLDFGEGTRVYEDEGSRPEKLMRKLTLVEELIEK